MNIFPALEFSNEKKSEAIIVVSHTHTRTYGTHLPHQIGSVQPSRKFALRILRKTSLFVMAVVFVVSAAAAAAAAADVVDGRLHLCLFQVQSAF